MTVSCLDSFDALLMVQDVMRLVAQKDSSAAAAAALQSPTIKELQRKAVLQAQKTDLVRLVSHVTQFVACPKTDMNLDNTQPSGASFVSAFALLPCRLLLFGCCELVLLMPTAKQRLLSVRGVE